MYGIGPNSSAPNSQRLCAGQARATQAQAGRRFCWRLTRGPAMRRSPGMSALAVHGLSRQTTFCPWQFGAALSESGGLGQSASSPARKKPCRWQPPARALRQAYPLHLELLADALVNLTPHESLSRETVRRRWPRTISNRGQGQVVHPPDRCGLRRSHGRCARSLCRGA